MERSNIQTLRRNKQGIRKNPLKSADFRGFLVRVARLERAASTSQMSRATNCTTPGYLVVMIIARNSCDSKSFPVCGHLCGQSCFLARFPGQAKSRKRPCFKDFRVSAVLVMDEKAYAPKAGALPMMNMGQEIPNPYYFNDLCRKVKNFPRHVSRSRCRITIHLGQENKKDEG